MSDAAKIVELPADSPLGNQLRVMATDRAAATPLPGPLASAFTRDFIAVGPHKVRKIVARDYRIWHQLDSPILKSMLELEKSEELREEVNVSDEEEWEICYQFLHPAREVQQELNKGREEFRKLVEAEIGDNPAVAPDIRLLMLAINEQIANHFSTMLTHAAEMKESGDVRFFQDGAKAPKTA